MNNTANEDISSKLKYIIEAFNSAGLTINEYQAQKYYKLFEYMVNYNKNVNLTSITEFKDVVIKHFIDSVLPFTLFGLTEGASFIDVGSGAGFPALPIMIYRPDLKVMLCDCLGKRCTYLKKACSEIEVTAEIIHARAEELGRKKRECFDLVTARAVSAMNILSEYCIPFIKVGGLFVALKSKKEDLTASENSIKLLGGIIENIIDYKLPNQDDRRVVFVRKVSETPVKYPRNSASISKNPL